VIAIDTNVLVRFLVEEDPAQTALAKKLFATSEIAIASTVLMETEWVLRDSYRYQRSDIVQVLRALLGLSAIWVQAREGVVRAVEAFDSGADFADALHALATESNVECFATFDRAFARRAAVLDLPAVRLLSTETDLGQV